ncbi:hypothetical protein HHK36_006479 [Tetracentron sinense]|uniref:Uncharacterized protein n=1 Tax=Tetracentron sinense TaxID=13715 RepID=A0A834ZI41_TETSI|nr:hypothetical protein HHK36_006479 [Tetracentron sinense]
MEQPATLNTVSPTPSPSSPSKKKEPQSQKKTKLPTPQELVAHYESQGLDNKEASMKVIEDLQMVLFRLVGSGRGKKDKFMAESLRKLEKSSTRLAILELKMDSKPGYGESLAIGVASGGICSVFPHVVGSIGQIWGAVRSSTKS